MMDLSSYFNAVADVYRYGCGSGSYHRLCHSFFLVKQIAVSH